jgi:hypothetical protein
MAAGHPSDKYNNEDPTAPCPETQPQAPGNATNHVHAVTSAELYDSSHLSTYSPCVNVTCLTPGRPAKTLRQNPELAAITACAQYVFSLASIQIAQHVVMERNHTVTFKGPPPHCSASAVGTRVATNADTAFRPLRCVYDLGHPYDNSGHSAVLANLQ